MDESMRSRAFRAPRQTTWPPSHNCAQSATANLWFERAITKAPFSSLARNVVRTEWLRRKRMARTERPTSLRRTPRIRGTSSVRAVAHGAGSSSSWGRRPIRLGSQPTLAMCQSVPRADPSIAPRSFGARQAARFAAGTLVAHAPRPMGEGGASTIRGAGRSHARMPALS